MIEREDVVRKLTERFGSDIYQWNDGKAEGMNRQLFAARLFADSDALAWVNALIHPVVREDVARWFAQQTSPVACVESAILYESHLDEAVDAIVVVDTPKEVRIQRVMKRNQCTREQVIERMDAQLNSDELKRRADFIIHNGGEDDVESQISNCIKRLTSSQT